jgi:hypothetical protein
MSQVTRSAVRTFHRQQLDRLRKQLRETAGIDGTEHVHHQALRDLAMVAVYLLDEVERLEREPRASS